MNTPITASECLRQAKALINTPEKWTKGWYWKYKDNGDIGNVETARKIGEARMCSLGAIYVVDGPGERMALDFLSRAMGMYPVHYNDNPARTHAEVMAKFDEAIALAEKEEKGE